MEKGNGGEAGEGGGGEGGKEAATDQLAGQKQSFQQCQYDRNANTVARQTTSITADIT